MPTFDWKQPVAIPRSLDPEYPARLRDEPGLYIFSRRRRTNEFEPFYVGQSWELCSRLIQYMRSKTAHEARIRNAIAGNKDSKTGYQRLSGPVYFHFGYLVPASHQRTGPTLDRAERALIHYALITGETLINHQHAGPAALHSFEMKGVVYDLMQTTIVSPRAKH